MVEIPLQQIPAQELQIILNNQNCTLSLYWRFGKLYSDLTVNSEPVFAGAMCQNCQWINQSPSLFFSGGLLFIDTLGDQAPSWEGLNDRWVLVYLTEEESNDVYSAVQAVLEE